MGGDGRKKQLKATIVPRPSNPVEWEKSLIANQSGNSSDIPSKG